MIVMVVSCWWWRRPGRQWSCRGDGLKHKLSLDLLTVLIIWTNLTMMAILSRLTILTIFHAWQFFTHDNLTMLTTLTIYALSEPPKVMFAHGFQSTLYCHGYLWPKSRWKMLYNLVGLWIWYHAWGRIKINKTLVSPPQENRFLCQSPAAHSHIFSYDYFRLCQIIRRSDYHRFTNIGRLFSAHYQIIWYCYNLYIFTKDLLFFTLNNLWAFPVALLYETTRQTWYLF